MKCTRYETDFCRGKQDDFLDRMPELVVSFGISQYRHYIERAFEELQNQHLLLEL